MHFDAGYHIAPIMAFFFGGRAWPGQPKGFKGAERVYSGDHHPIVPFERTADPKHRVYVSHIQIPQVSFHLLEGSPEKPSLNSNGLSAYIADAAKISVGVSRRKSLKVFLNETVPVLLLRLSYFSGTGQDRIYSRIESLSNPRDKFVSQQIAAEPKILVRGIFAPDKPLRFRPTSHLLSRGIQQRSDQAVWSDSPHPGKTCDAGTAQEPE
jgi:hypothetical protein